MSVLINHQGFVPPLFKVRFQKGHFAFVSASDFYCDIQNTDKVHRKKEDEDDLKAVLY